MRTSVRTNIRIEINFSQLKMHLLDFAGFAWVGTASAGRLPTADGAPSESKFRVPIWARLWYVLPPETIFCWVKGVRSAAHLDGWGMPVCPKAEGWMQPFAAGPCALPAARIFPSGRGFRDGGISKVGAQNSRCNFHLLFHSSQLQAKHCHHSLWR